MGLAGLPYTCEPPSDNLQPLLGGSWVVISGVISRVTIVITQIGGLITPFITSHEPPSMT